MNATKAMVKAYFQKQHDENMLIPKEFLWYHVNKGYAILPFLE